MAVLLASTGMRTGEMLGLEWADVDLAAGHAARREGARVARYGDRPALRAASEPRAHVALDMDRKARQQLGAEQVEALRAALEMHHLRIADADLEQIADLGVDLGRADVDRLDFLLGAAAQPVRRQPGEVESLRGLLAEREKKRLHGRRSFR